MKYLIANWKMNQSLEEIENFIANVDGNSSHFLGVAPQSIHLHLVQKMQDKGIKTGAQNIGAWKTGAYTGEISALHLKELGHNFCIIGHSERRQYFSESLIHIKQKVELALEQKLICVLCVGETKEEKDNKQTFAVLEKQILTALNGLQDLSHIIIAYEPVWAIGTGLTAQGSDIVTNHGFIQELCLSKLGFSPPILYGGSVNDANAKDLSKLAHVSGFLVGGASLAPARFNAMASQI